MFSFVIFSFVFVGLCTGRPQDPPAAPPAAVPTGSGGTPIPIIKQTQDNNPDGSFQFSYETGNGIKVEEKGYLKDGANASEKIQVIEGSVSYTDNEGNPVNLKYIADENGFQPEGDHIPKTLGSQQGAQPNAGLSAAPTPYSSQLAGGVASQPSGNFGTQPAQNSEVQPASF